MERIRKIVIQGKEIIAIDYSGLKESEMISLVIEAKGIIIETPQPKLVITSYRNTFVTPAYMRHVEREVEYVGPLILRNALVGLNMPKMMILKGFNLLLGTGFQAFATEREAIEYLIGEPVGEELKPIFS
ncbi:MAG: hypothetical protein KF845_15295 [Cyclobacteriaceae bacterium]|nr:hypothetical protein [Cyclobacteriaceae bacterium]